MAGRWEGWARREGAIAYVKAGELKPHAEQAWATWAERIERTLVAPGWAEALRAAFVEGFEAAGQR